MAGVGRRRRGKSQDDATFFRVLRGEVVVGGKGWGGWEGAPRSCHAATFMPSSASLLKVIHMSTRVNASKAFFGVGGVMVKFFSQRLHLAPLSPRPFTLLVFMRPFIAQRSLDVVGGCQRDWKWF